MMKIENLRDIECFVFDMDGTLYLGNNVIEGAHELIALLEEKGIKYFYFTNNSSRSPMEYVSRLNRLGFAGVTLFWYLPTPYRPARWFGRWIRSSLPVMS